jgi:hypothetical protein
MGFGLFLEDERGKAGKGWVASMGWLGGKGVGRKVGRFEVCGHPSGGGMN